MKFEHFIAQRLSSGLNSGKDMSHPAVRIAVMSIAVGMAVMLVAMAVVVGFKREVRNQVIGFGSHISIFSGDGYDPVSSEAIVVDDSIENMVLSCHNVAKLQHIVSQAGIINTPSAFQGVILKGIDHTFDWNFFEKHILSGTILKNDTADNGAIISSAMANTLSLDLNDDFIVYFVTDRLRARRFTVRGIYETTFADYDKLYIITHLSNIRQINGFADYEYSSLELIVRDYDAVDYTAAELFSKLSVMNRNPLPKYYKVETIETLTPQIFSWLGMLDINAVVILILMLAVSGFCVISGLLILILERRPTIGLLKSLGANNSSIRKIFILQGATLVTKGTVYGNAIGLAIIAIQYFTHIIPLDPVSYYVNHVPVYLSFTTWLGLNVGMAGAAMLMLYIPTLIVTGIAPAETMQRE